MKNLSKEEQPSSSESVESPRPAHEEGLPLCSPHQSLEDRGNLEVRFGNGCVACSLNEREELLRILAPHVPLEGWVDSVGFLRQKLAALERIATAHDAMKAALEKIVSTHCGVPGHTVARNCGAQGIAYDALQATATASAQQPDS